MVGPSCAELLAVDYWTVWTGEILGKYVRVRNMDALQMSVEFYLNMYGKVAVNRPGHLGIVFEYEVDADHSAEQGMVAWASYLVNGW